MVDDIVNHVITDRSPSDPARAYGWAVQTISEFSPDDLRSFFERIINELRRLEFRPQAVDGVRNALGAWYGSIVLADLGHAESWNWINRECLKETCNIHGSRSPGPSNLQKRMMVIAKEALHWHTDALLCNVVVALRKRAVNQILHCTSLKGSDCNQLNTFLGYLEGYIQQRGTSAKQDGHLSQSARKINLVEAQDLLLSAFNPEVVVSRCNLTPVPSKQPSKSTFIEDVLRPVFGDGQYGLIHFAEGGDTNYLSEENNLGAVAHMYVAFRGTGEKTITVHQDYIEAMEELLSRLAMAYALDEIQRTRDELDRQVTEERRRNARLLERIIDLDRSIVEIEEKARGVRDMVTDIGTSLDSWIRFVSSLFDHPPVKISICGCQEIRSNHDPDSSNEETWVHHFSAGLLAFVNASRSPDQRFQGLSHQAYWKLLLESSNPDTPPWRILRRLGFRPGSWEDCKKAAFDIYKYEWKGALRGSKPGELNYALIKWSLGAQFACNSQIISDDRLMIRFWDTTSVSRDKLVPLRRETILGGLYALFEALFSYKADTRNLSLENTFLEVQKEDEATKIRLSPIEQQDSYGKKAVALIDQSGFEKVLQKVAELSSRGFYPDPSKHNTSRSLLRSLGIDDTNWNAKPFSIENGRIVSKWTDRHQIEAYWEEGLWIVFKGGL